RAGDAVEPRAEARPALLVLVLLVARLPGVDGLDHLVPRRAVLLAQRRLAVHLAAQSLLAIGELVPQGRRGERLEPPLQGLEAVLHAEELRLGDAIVLRGRPRE